MDITEDFIVITSQSDLHLRNPYFLNLLFKGGKKELTSVKIWITLYKKVKKLNFHDKCQLCHFFHVFNTHGSLPNKQSRALPFFQIKYLPKSLESNCLLYNTYQMLIFEGSG